MSGPSLDYECLSPVEGLDKGCRSGVPLVCNTLGKPLDSVIGYISVLPDPFSAYRYEALWDISSGVGPLSSYLNDETMLDSADVGISEFIMDLAEDRILCFRLVAETNEAWVAHLCQVRQGFDRRPKLDRGVYLTPSSAVEWVVLCGILRSDPFHQDIGRMPE
jgi:cellulose synthase/poly-beta-1,6-N-acetylglucosamine synthase-like glycosyltransferase